MPADRQRREAALPARRYLEDFKVGDVIEMGPRSVTRDEIVAFARKFDPQPFHVDEDAARASPYGGLIASGWHTMAMCMRMMVDGYIRGTESMGSPGIDELRWLKPVRPGDVLRLRQEVVEVLPSRSKPDRGIVKSAHTLSNQDGQVVMTLRGMGMYRRRPEVSGAGEPR